ncbi:hypothetical protein ACJ73_02927 [Blastomyces percursus]|uniref:Uncharacterized protein n=1 Tax=Blastomyces percursus TaxID=1658174 RepID=A0A1J9QB69_9EURO|nr:hypothetical protein ACJ73_02927 [Blastomyces percursus]
MSLTKDSEAVMLNGPNDWELWEEEFKKQLNTLDLEDEVLKGAKLLEKPKVDLPEPPVLPVSMAVRAPQDTPARNTRGQSATAAAAAGTPTVADSQATVDTAATLTEDSAADKRFERDYKTYQMQNAAYNNAVRAYDRSYDRFVQQKNALNKLKLKLRVEEGVAKLEDELKDYFEAICDPRVTVRNWSKWIDVFEITLSRMEAKDMRMVTDSKDWYRLFERRLKKEPAHAFWADSYRIHYRIAITAGTLKFREVAAHFRARLPTRNAQANRGQVTKGAFAVSFAGDSEAFELAEDAPGESSEVKKAPGRNKRKQADRNPISFSSPPPKERKAEDEAGCAACGETRHRLERCWKAYPELAPRAVKGKFYKANKELNLAKRPRLAKKLEKVRATRKARKEAAMLAAEVSHSEQQASE